MSQIPFSNPGGNNQTSPGAGVKAGMGAFPVPSPVGPTVHNPFVPPGVMPPGPGLHTTHPMATGGVGAVPQAASTPFNAGAPGNTSADNGFITNNSSYKNGENDLQKQLVDIYGKGVGGSLFSLLNSMSGTNSTVLQEYIKSLQPAEAAASANIGASLGAAGVSGNSSVNAIAQSNLQAQEFASIAGESAKLTMTQEELTAQLLSGTQGAASKEVASSAWTTFADVINNITGDIGNLAGGDYQTKAGSGSGGATPAVSAPQLPSFSPAAGDTTNYNGPYWAGLGGW